MMNIDHNVKEIRKLYIVNQHVLLSIHALNTNKNYILTVEPHTTLNHCLKFDQFHNNIINYSY